MSPRLRAALALVALSLAALAAYWYVSPALVLRRMHAAARAGDAEAFNAHVDYPRLRESLKRELALSLGWPGAAPGRPEDDTLGARLGRAVLERLVDATVRPEVVMQLMRVGRLARGDAAADDAPAGASGPGRGRLVWTAERPGPDRYVAYALREGAPPGQRVGLVFERRGFADWRLVELRLPPDAAGPAPARRPAPASGPRP
jgi:hypothetical protein